ncbi:unnamed protein product [Pleuronectes platessa]|uniref:Uncharacterized protein n=1 Tax=Pleuronectes platessa TaxID=8262 RepID=A0A9N7YCG2_PLEPL|nr:unnamed protein product [Pleuronectes platessa]
MRSCREQKQVVALSSGHHRLFCTSATLIRHLVSRIVINPSTQEWKPTAITGDTRAMEFSPTLIWWKPQQIHGRKMEEHVDRTSEILG